MLFTSHAEVEMWLLKRRLRHSAVRQILTNRNQHYSLEFREGLNLFHSRRFCPGCGPDGTRSQLLTADRRLLTSDR